MVTAKTGFHFTDPITNQTAFYAAGDTVPDHIAAEAGQHVLNGRKPIKAAPVDAQTPEDVQALVALHREFADRVKDLEEELVTALMGREQDAALIAELREQIQQKAPEPADQVPTSADPDGAPLFDPGKHNADEVLAYLERADSEESERVRALERAGKARRTVLGDE